MRLKALLFTGVIAFASTAAMAQSWVVDSVEMGANYANDIFYSLKDGFVKQEDASNWHLAFQMTQFGEPNFNASIRANHIKGQVEVYSLHMQASTNFDNLSAGDTIGKTYSTMQLINIDTTWGNGALYQNRNLSDPFDFGWGEYQGPPMHNLLGDSLYLIKVNNVPYKLWVKEYISMPPSPIGYRFRIAAFDNSSDDTFYVEKQNYPNRLYAYYNITTKTFTDREPSKATWDLLFTQYPKYLIFGPSGLQAYTGVLTNQGVEAAELTNIDPDTVAASSYASYTPMMTSHINVIGDDWKTFNMSTFTYEIDTLKSWIVKSSNTQEYYQLKFTRFDGASGGATGKIVFAKRFVAVTSVKEIVSNVSAYSIYPNPANTSVNLMIDAKEKAGQAKVTITDLSGRVVYAKMVAINSGINAYMINTSGLASGTYIVNLTDGSWKAAEKLIVQH